MKHLWKLTRIRRLDNNCSIIQFDIETTEGTLAGYTFCAVGVLMIPDEIFDALLDEASINAYLISRNLQIADITE